MTEEKDEKFIVIDESSLHRHRTELPNILFDLDLDPYEFRLYCHIKKIAGDGGSCWMSVTRLAKETKISVRKIQTIKKKLASGFSKLGGLPLIKVTKRKTDLGDPDTDLIQMLDLWRLNFQKAYGLNKKPEGVHPVQGGGARDAPGVVHEMHQGGAPGADKEDPIKEDPIEEVESQLADASRRRATFLFEKIKSINPKAKKPNIDAWAKDIEKLMRIDGRSEEEVTRVIEWVFNDDFWCKNILSGRKLREKFDQLYINMVKHKESPKKKEEDAAKKKADMCRKNKEWATKFLVDKNFDSLDNKLTLKDNGVEVKFNGGWQIIGFLENGFREQIENFYRKMAA